MAHTAAATLLDTLCDWHVEVIFGLPGDGINGLMESLRKAEGKIRFIQVRHEEAAAFMACAYAKYTAASGYVWRPPAPAACTCSTASTMPSSISSQCSPSPATTITTSSTPTRSRM